MNSIGIRAARFLFPSGVLAAGLAAVLALDTGKAAAQGVGPCPLGAPPAAVGTGLGAVTTERLRALYRAFPPLRLGVSESVDCGVADDSDRAAVFYSPRIVVNEDWVPGIYIWHQANGDLGVYVHGTDLAGKAIHHLPTAYEAYAVRTMGDGEYWLGEEAHGVWAEHGGEGRIGIDFRDLSLSTAGNDSHGLFASQEGDYVWEDGASRRARGAVIINLIETDRDRAARTRPIIGTRGDDSDAVRAVYTGGAAYGHIAVTVEGYTIATGGIVPLGPQIPTSEGGNPPTGADSRGIHARHEGRGDIRVSVTDSHVLTWGAQGHGIFADHLGWPATITNLDGSTEVRTGGGAVDIDVTGGEIRTEGGGAIGVYGFHRGLGGVSIDATDLTIATTGEESHGVMGWIRKALPSDRLVAREPDDPAARSGVGDIAISVTGGAISTTGGARSATDGPVSREGFVAVWGRAFAVWGVHDNEGDIAVTVAGDAATSGEGAHAIFAEHRGARGDVALTVGGGAIATAGREAHGAYATNAGGGAVTTEGAVTASVTGGSVTTEGAESHGVFSVQNGDGTLNVRVTGGSVTTEGAESHGVLAVQNGDEALTVRVTGGAVTAKGDDAHGVEAHGVGDVTVAVDGGSVAAQGARGAGVLARSIATREDKGAVTVSVGAGGRVSTASGIGIYSDGPRDLNVSVAGRVEGDIFHDGDGMLILELPEGGVVTGTVHDPRNPIVVHGSIGRLFYNTGASVTVARGGKLTGVEAELDGVKQTQAIRSLGLAGLAGDLTVTVQDGGAVTGSIVIEGSGDHTIVIERGGTLSAAAVTATANGGGLRFDRVAPAAVGKDATGTGEAIVHRNGNLTATVRGAVRGHIVSESGRLTATVAGTVDGDIRALGSGDHVLTLESGSTVTGMVRRATEGTITAGGTVGRLWFDRGGTAVVGEYGRILGIDGNGVLSKRGELTVEVLQGAGETPAEALLRALGDKRFTIIAEGEDGVLTVQTRVPGEKTPRILGDLGTKGSFPDGAYDVGVALGADGTVRVSREFAPRSRVYEALPSVLLALNGLSTAGERMAAARDSGAWGRIEGARATWTAERSTTGAEYDLRRHGVQAGLELPVDEAGSVLGFSLHQRGGLAKVPRGGEILASAFGVGLYGTWRRGDFYMDGQAETTWHEAALDSSIRNRLNGDVSGYGHAWGVEAGHRMAWGDFMVTPRVRLVGSAVSVSDFEDTTTARVSLDEGRSMRGRGGVYVETRPLRGGTRLSGTVDVEREFEDSRQVTVSGTALPAKERATRFLLGLGGVHDWGGDRYTLAGKVNYATSSSGGSREYGGELNLTVRF